MDSSDRGGQMVLRQRSRGLEGFRSQEIHLSVDWSNKVWTIAVGLKPFSWFCTQRSQPGLKLFFFLGKAAQKKIRRSLILCQNYLQQQTRTWLQPYLLPFQHCDSCGISSLSRTMWTEEVYTWGINRERRWIQDPTCKRPKLGRGWCSKPFLFVIAGLFNYLVFYSPSIEGEVFGQWC